ncbi:hypothetical protein PI124_g13546 [Phytophthora idaei]|nr:hypothetical protein PI125_g14359 [Phytophthora idaei]KAG3145829.1 hypothetical protein PI126_g13569 [Phytophthora idaei]KAG3241594.1 hypothetical protein PI124_g13546 [Phytophthora idaei]
MTEAKEMSTAQATAVTTREPVAASACTDTPATEVGADIAASVEAATPAQTSVHARSAARPSAGKRNRLTQAATRTPRRAVLQYGEEDDEEVRYVCSIQHKESCPI